MFYRDSEGLSKRAHFHYKIFYNLRNVLRQIKIKRSRFLRIGKTNKDETKCVKQIKMKIMFS